MLSFGESFCYLLLSPLLSKVTTGLVRQSYAILIIEEITKDNKKIPQKITKFRKEVILNSSFGLGGVVLANSGDIFKHSDKFSF